MKPFQRRHYHSLSEPLLEARDLISHRDRIRRAMRSQAISKDFRERLMLAVTAVNRCRYCSYYHAGEALRAGVPSQEMGQLLAGEIPGSIPEAERPAILYAQHWAEQNAHPDPETQQQLVKTYGLEMTEHIETVLRMIRMGNLSGNTFDYLLYRLSFGRLGNPQPVEPDIMGR